MTEITEAIVMLTDAVKNFTLVVLGVGCAGIIWIGDYLKAIRDALRS